LVQRSVKNPLNQLLFSSAATACCLAASIGLQRLMIGGRTSIASSRVIALDLKWTKNNKKCSQLQRLF
jgi:hypothetical protein